MAWTEDQPNYKRAWLGQAGLRHFRPKSAAHFFNCACPSWVGMGGAFLLIFHYFFFLFLYKFIFN